MKTIQRKKTKRGNWVMVIDGKPDFLKIDISQISLDILAVTLIICNFIYYG